jgi:hypothetical protein
MYVNERIALWKCDGLVVEICSWLCSCLPGAHVEVKWKNELTPSDVGGLVVKI